MFKLTGRKLSLKDLKIAKETSFQLDALGLPPVLASLDKLPPFNHLNTKITDVHKTGLGSSAALITSLVSSLLVHLSVIPKSSLANSSSFRLDPDSAARRDVDLIHNASQYIHCLAQGKVGSGFDVSSAVYGSQTYKRFDDSVLKPLMVEGESSSPTEVSRNSASRTLRLIFAYISVSSCAQFFVRRPNGRMRYGLLLYRRFYA
jgi:ERG8-type phosphomevalonate kinase